MKDTSNVRSCQVQSLDDVLNVLCERLRIVPGICNDFAGVDDKATLESDRRATSDLRARDIVRFVSLNVVPFFLP